MTTKLSVKHVLLAAATIGTVLAISGGTISAVGEKEECCGISAAGKNDCATATSSCAGMSKVDRQGDAAVAAGVDGGLHLHRFDRHQHVAGGDLSLAAR